jgi:hypothetical protein
MRATRRMGVLVLVGVLGVLAACVPPTTSSVQSGAVYVCTPTNAYWDHLNVTFDSVPPGSGLDWEDSVGDLFFTAEPGHSNSVVAGQTVAVGVARQGRCVYLVPSGGLTFRYTPVLATDLGQWYGQEPYRQGFAPM